MDFELTFSQEQKIKRYVSRFRFAPEALERAIGDMEIEADGKGRLSQTNDDVEAYTQTVDVTPFVHNLLGRPCHCPDCSNGLTEDPEFRFYADRVHDLLWAKFESTFIRMARERAEVKRG